jgi:hypothetical protein
MPGTFINIAPIRADGEHHRCACRAGMVLRRRLRLRFA